MATQHRAAPRRLRALPGHAPTVTPPPGFRAGPRPSALELPVRGGAPAPELEGAEAGSEGLLFGGFDPPGAAVGFPRLQTHGPTAPRMEGRPLQGWRPPSGSKEQE